MMKAVARSFYPGATFASKQSAFFEQFEKELFRNFIARTNATVDQNLKRVRVGLVRCVSRNAASRKAVRHKIAAV
jgi:hypothetical protein